MTSFCVRGALLLAVTWFPLGCKDDAPVEPCDAGIAMNESIAIAVAEPPYEAVGESDVSVVVRLSAAIQCFSGGTRVALSTSLGKIGEAGPGQTAAVFIGPAGPSNERLSGELELILPEGRVARLDARLGDQVATKMVGPFVGMRDASKGDVR